jgi:hypothetical protein
VAGRENRPSDARAEFELRGALVQKLWSTRHGHEQSDDGSSTGDVNPLAGNTAKLGRQVLWNTAFQYQTAWKLWPELEANSTFYTTGKYAGETQIFLTPKLGFGPVHFAGRFRLSSAVGVQIAATQFKTYNHRWLFSTRVSF